MGIQFAALDTTRTRETPGGTVAARVELGEEWEFFGWNFANAAVLFTLLQVEPSEDCAGALTVPDARRAIMYARATFDSRAPALAREGFEVRRGYVGGLDLEGLSRRLEDFATFVEVAASAGADLISWS